MSSSRDAKRKSSSKKRRSRDNTHHPHPHHPHHPQHHHSLRTNNNHHSNNSNQTQIKRRSKHHHHTLNHDDPLNIDHDIDIRMKYQHENPPRTYRKSTDPSSISAIKKKRRGLNINLSATPIKSLATNTKKARSKPTMSTRDLATNRNSKPYNFVTHNININNKHYQQQQQQQQQRDHNDNNNQYLPQQPPSRRSLKPKKTSTARYKKRISAPIILPTSTTGSLSTLSGPVTANLDHPTVPNTPNTPYYSNKGATKHRKNEKKHHHHHHHKESKHKHQDKVNKKRKTKATTITTTGNGEDGKQKKVIREKEEFLNLSPNNTLTTNSNSSTNSQETIIQKHAKRNYSSKSITHSTDNDDTNSSSTSQDDLDESDEYLDETEINEMIRSCRRISKSRPRAYSKTRRVSQKLFGLMESFSLDNDIEKKKKKKGIGYIHSDDDKHDHDEDIDINDDDMISNTADSKECELKFEIDSDELDEDKHIETEEELIRGKEAHDYHDTLRRYGYIEIRVIAKSLQGIVIEAEYIDKKRGGWDTVIIKITDKQLHFNKISNKHGKSLSVQEDIIKEKKLLMYLTANNPPSSLTKFLGFFEDKYNYYLVMENGGTDFFDWIVKCHKWIRDGKLSLKQWNLYIHDLMVQIIKFLKWLHQKMNVCHLDISLENMLIKNNKYKSDGNGGIRLSRKMQIKFCDFGLAEYFDINTNSTFHCKKYVGKTHYKAPKVYGKKESFDARKADIWSLGVSFFMMVIGAPPYKLPLSSDDHFPLIQQNNVMAILKRWGRDHYINKYTESLLNQMLQIDELKRISIYNIESHPYFTQHQKTTITKRRSTHDILTISKSLQKKSANHSSKRKKKRKPSNPIHSNIMATYHDNDALMESPPKPNINTNHNIFQNLVMSEDDGQLFRYRKRKLTST